MNPDYENAAYKAIETIISYNIDPNFTDPLPILKSLNNVKMISYGVSEINEAGFYCNSEMFAGSNKDAFSLASRINGQLKYIVIYDYTISPIKLRYALSRELGHVMLEHDGNSPEEIWTEEANCFAYHFLCPMPLLYNKKEPAQKPINYRPIRDNLHWELKEAQVFNSLEEMKLFVIEEMNGHDRFTGKSPVNYKFEDVHLKETYKREAITGWKNCHDIVLAGVTVGHCGE